MCVNCKNEELNFRIQQLRWECRTGTDDDVMRVRSQIKTLTSELITMIIEEEISARVSAESLN